MMEDSTLIECASDLNEFQTRVSLGTKLDLPTHDPKSERRLAFMASNETAADGSHW
jgi:hypothetical protein